MQREFDQALREALQRRDRMKLDVYQQDSGFLWGFPKMVVPSNYPKLDRDFLLKPMVFFGKPPNMDMNN